MAIGALFIVATPIGNLKDITLRALDTLKSVDCVFCEDTRVTSKLLNHYQIKKPLKTLTDFNEAKKVDEIVKLIKAGQRIALVSDAGTPLISDPGFKLVRECLVQGLPVEVVPGPSAVLPALLLSGLPTDKFSFWGYLPRKSFKRQEFLGQLVKIQTSFPQTLIFFESPHRLIKTLKDIRVVFGDIQIVIARELTKLHEEIRREKISKAIEHFGKHKPKGEVTLLINPLFPSKSPVPKHQKGSSGESRRVGARDSAD